MEKFSKPNDTHFSADNKTNKQENCMLTFSGERKKTVTLRGIDMAMSQNLVELKYKIVCFQCVIYVPFGRQDIIIITLIFEYYTYIVAAMFSLFEHCVNFFQMFTH